MAIGPFDSFVFPGVYTRTLNEPPKATAAGDIRVPAIIGTASDTFPVSNYEMFRGSSSMADNPIVKEDVSSQFTGTERNFTVTYFPIVTGAGTGTATTNPKDVTVYIDSNPVPVASVNGVTGEIYLVNIVPMGSLVEASYYFKNTDTLHTAENLSNQADSIRTVFRTHYFPIVRGDNGGITTTSPSSVVVLVNGGAVTVSAVDGESGQITLAAAPSSSDLVEVTYYSNDKPNTADILPTPHVASITRVGYSPGASDFVEGLDFVLDTSGEFNTLQWGNSLKLAVGTHTIGFGYWDATASLYDVYNVRRPASGTIDGTNTDFVMEYAPVTGEGRGTLTNNPSKLIAYVGTSPTTATLATILSVDGAARTVSLLTPPTADSTVFVTEYVSSLTTDQWILTSTTSGDGTNGRYQIQGASAGNAMSVLFSDASSHVNDSGDFTNENITYPDGNAVTLGDNDTFSDAYIIPGSSEETIFLSFTSPTDYTVSSSIAHGTGSVGDNRGYLNQTYKDNKSGFKVTIMEGALVDYSSGDVLAYTVSPTFKTSSTKRSRAVPGVKLTVPSTTGLNTGTDTEILNTYNLANASEPSIGDFYYVSFQETKQFDSNGLTQAKLYTNEKDIINDTGDLTIDNKIGVGAHLAFLNGAAAVVLLQLQKTPGGTDAPNSRYIAGIDYFNEPMAAGLRPVLMQPMTTSTNVLNYLKVSNSIQSGIRYGNEHVSFFGFPTNTTPTVAQAYAKSIKSERMIAVYPDGATITLADALGNEVQYLVGGEYLAMAIAGRDVSPAFDVAEPLTKKPVVGFDYLFRRMDSVTSAQTANAGITLIEEVSSGLQIKFGLTTDISSVLTRTPSIIRTKDFIQRGARSILSPYIGTKLLLQRISDVERTLESYLASLQQASIISGYIKPVATQDAADPTILNVEASYSPVYPLLWIVITFNLRSSI